MTLVLILELATIVLAVILYLAMSKMGQKRIWQKFVIMFLAVLLFMMMSLPMYRNPGLDNWAYFYGDLPWTLVLGWTEIFLLSMLIVDNYWKGKKESIKFWLYLVVVTIITVPVESFLLKIGIRGYSSVLTDTFSGFMIPLTQVPIEVFLAVPILSALIIGFYKYMSNY